ncbi:hypothetical protein ACQP2X_16465 [Actinoplanes sp. CA-131856]
MKIRLITGVSVVLAASLALTACGGKSETSTGGDTKAAPASSAPAANPLDALTGQQILDKSRAALKSAKSYHVAGSMVDEGAKVTLDLKIAGSDVFGFFAMKEGKIELLSVGKDRYFRPNAGFWADQLGAQGKTLAKVIGKRWVKIDPSDKDTASMFDITNMSDILEPEGAVEKTTVKQIDGKPAQGLSDSVDGKGGALFVAAEGETYPLRLEGPTPADGSLAFTEYGKTFAEIKAPAAADVFDMKNYGK